jgi:hypothetical protein
MRSKPALPATYRISSGTFTDSFRIVASADGPPAAPTTVGWAAPVRPAAARWRAGNTAPPEAADSERAPRRLDARGTAPPDRRRSTGTA